MGLASWLVDIGISFEKASLQLGVRAGTVPLQWPAGPVVGESSSPLDNSAIAGSLMYRLPRDPHQRASLFSKVQTIVVNEGEVAVVLEDGRSQGALEPGRYVFQKARVVSSLDIVWLKTGQQALKWGIGNIASSDGIQISGNGMLYVKVTDGRAFNAEVVQGAIKLSEVDLQRFLMPRIQGVLRSAIPAWEAIALQSQREAFTAAVRRALGDTFANMGLGIVDLEVIEVNFPPEFKAAIAGVTMARHLGNASIVEAHARAQMVQLEASAAAQAQLTTGLAQVQVMAQMQAHGIDPLKLKAMEALQTLAATPAQGGSLISGDAAKAQLFGQIAMAALTAPAVPLVPPAPLVPAQSSVPQIAATAAAPTETRADIERQIDALTERLSEGKLTEELYNKLTARLESKLAKLA